MKKLLSVTREKQNRYSSNKTHGSAFVLHFLLAFRKLASPVFLLCFFLSILLPSSQTSVYSQLDPSTPPTPAADDTGPSDFYVSGNSSRITLELKGVDIIDVLKVLSKKSGLNIIAGTNVRGQVTMFLQDVNVMEALRIILATSELAYEEENGIIKVTTQRDYEALYGRPYQDKRVTEVIPLQYTDAQTVSVLINELKTNIGKVVVDDRSNSLIVVDIPEAIKAMKDAILSVDKQVMAKIFTLKYSEAEDIEAKISEMITPTSGSVKVDKRSNRLVVIDFPEKVRQIEHMVEAFDVKPSQVLIEARIVEVTLNDDYALGIDWSLVFEHSSQGQFAFDAQSFGGLSNFATGPLSTGDFTSFTINSAGDDFSAVITALEGMGKTNTLSSPRISVLNGEEATISVATSQPYVSQTVVQGDTTSTTADNIEFVDVGVVLTVKPKITDDRKVLLKVKPQVSSQASSPFVINQFDSSGNVVGTRASVPIVTKQEVETTVLVSTGKTVVIGGLIQDTESKISKKVPVIGDLPLLGQIFRQEAVDNTKSELVLFLTPSIMDDDMSFEEEQGRYLQKNGRLLEFNKVGDLTYDYDKSRTDSITPFKSRQQPYWDRQKEQAMERDLHGATLESLLMNRPAVSKQSKKELISGAATMSDYRAQIVRMVNLALKARPEFTAFRGQQAKIILQLLKDGTVDSIGFPRIGFLNEKALREVVTDVISNISPFPPFPAGSSEQEVPFEIEISL